MKTAKAQLRIPCNAPHGCRNQSFVVGLMACWLVGLLACWPCALLTIMPPNPQTTTPDAHKTCLTPTRCESASLEQRTPRKAQNPNSRATPTPPPPWGCTGGRATPRGGGGRGCTEMRVSGILGLVSLPWRGWGSRRQQHDLATRCANNGRHRMRNNRRLQTCNVPLFETFGNFTSKGRSGRPLCRRALHRMRNSRHFQTLSDLQWPNVRNIRQFQTCKALRGPFCPKNIISILGLPLDTFIQNGSCWPNRLRILQL